MKLKTTLRKDEFETVKMDLDKEDVILKKSEIETVKISKKDILKTKINKNDIEYVRVPE